MWTSVSLLPQASAHCLHFVLLNLMTTIEARCNTQGDIEQQMTNRAQTRMDRVFEMVGPGPLRRQPLHTSYTPPTHPLNTPYTPPKHPLNTPYTLPEHPL